MIALKGKKKIAPIVITILLVLYFAGFLFLWLVVPLPFWGKVVGCIIPLALIGVCIAMMMERLEEIEGGEEDDLSKY